MTWNVLDAHLCPLWSSYGAASKLTQPHHALPSVAPSSKYSPSGHSALALVLDSFRSFH